MPRWSIAQVGLFRVGSGALSEYARSGTVEVLEDDPNGPLKLSFSVDFGETPKTMGTVAVGQ